MKQFDDRLEIRVSSTLKDSVTKKLTAKDSLSSLIRSFLEEQLT